MRNPLNLEFTEEYPSIYWGYNCPLQMWPVYQNPDDEDSPIVGWQPVNYMPRKERCVWLGEEVSPATLPVYCKNAAKVLMNLAKLFDLMAEGKIKIIYYPDEIIPDHGETETDEK